MTICEKDKCTACFACVNICPVGCISMKTSEDLSLETVVDSTKCINCEMCKKICPSNNPVEFNQIKKCYASYSKNVDTNKKSTSGGIATELAKKVVISNGIVYGSALNSDLTVSFKRCTTLDDVKSIQGSKYVFSRINNIFKDVYKDIISNKTVLFIATPCQIAGLNAFLKHKKYDNLYTVDIICHGTPSEKVFIDYAKSELKDNFNQIDYVTFRKNDNYELNFMSSGKSVKTLFWRESEYLDAFLQGNIFRENCYNCNYAKKERVSDITLGDFWGLGEVDKFDDNNKYGINAVLINTDKGQQLFNQIKGNVVYYERKIEEAINGNGQLRFPCKESENAKKFRLLCKSHGACYALKNYNKRKCFLVKARHFIYKHEALHKILLSLPVIKNKI